jgi:hypothetical protein
MDYLSDGIFAFIYLWTAPEPVQAHAWCCLISSIGHADCPTWTWTHDTLQKAYVQCMYVLLTYVVPALSCVTHALDMGYERVGSFVDRASGSVNIEVCHHRNAWIIVIMLTCVCIIALSVCGVALHLMDIFGTAWKALTNMYKATRLMLYHQSESWRNGLSNIAPFMVLIIQILRVLAFIAPFLLIDEIFVSGVGVDLWRTVAIVASNFAVLIPWFIKYRTGWDFFSKVTSVFENKRLTTEWDQLQQYLRDVGNGTVPVTHAMTPEQMLNAIQLQQAFRQ